MKVDEGWWRLFKVDECWWRLMNVDEGWWMFMNVDEGWWMLMNVDEGWWRSMRPHMAMWHGIDMLKTCYKMWLLPSHHGNPKIHSECTSLWIHGHSPRWDDAWNVDELIRIELRIPIISQPSIYDHLWIFMDILWALRFRSSMGLQFLPLLTLIQHGFGRCWWDNSKRSSVRLMRPQRHRHGEFAFWPLREI